MVLPLLSQTSGGGNLFIRLSNFLINSNTLLVSLIILVVLCLLFYILYKLIFVSYPRMSWINHSANLDDYLEIYGEQVRKSLSVLRKHTKFKKFTLDDEDVIFYAKYSDFIKVYPSKNPMTRRFLESIEQDNIEDEDSEKIKKNVCDESGFFDAEKFSIYRGTFLNQVVEMRDILEKEHKNKFKDREYEMAIHHLHILLNTYFNTLYEMFMKRTKGMSFRLFVFYLSELFDTIYRKIIKLWVGFLDSVKERTSSILEYVDSKEEWFSKLPFMFVDSKGQQFDNPHRRDDKQVNFSERDMIKDDEQIIENFFLTYAFLGAILPPILLIMVFFKDLFKLVFNLIKIVFVLFEALANPIKFVKILFGFLIGTSIFITYIVVRMVLKFGLAFFLTFILSAVSKILISVLWIKVFIVASAILIIVWILDTITQGHVFPLLRCENLPNAWIYSDNYAYNNIFGRFLFCRRPCQSSYAPGVTGLFCDKQKRDRPIFCPQQLIMQYFENKEAELPSNYIFNLNLNPRFWLLNENEKREYIKEFEDRRKLFLKTCHDNYNKYDFAVLNTCRNFDKSQTSYLNLCHQLYCDDNQYKKEKFCGVITKNTKTEEDFRDIVTFTFHSMLLLLLSIVVLYACIYICVSLLQTKYS